MFLSKLSVLLLTNEDNALGRQSPDTGFESFQQAPCFSYSVPMWTQD